MSVSCRTRVVLAGHSRYNVAPTGSIFGKWKVLGNSHYNNEHHWKVECTCCSKEYTRRASQLTLRRSSRLCSNKERGCRSVSAQYLNRLMHRPKEVTITLEDLADK